MPNDPHVYRLLDLYTLSQQQSLHLQLPIQTLATTQVAFQLPSPMQPALYSDVFIEFTYNADHSLQQFF